MIFLFGLLESVRNYQNVKFVDSSAVMQRTAADPGFLTARAITDSVALAFSKPRNVCLDKHPQLGR